MATYEENLAQMSQPYQFAPLPIRGGGQDRAFTGLLGNIFGGGGVSGLEEYLTPAQTEQMNRQALLQAAIAATQASGPSTTPRSFMQILGAGLAGGQQGYQQAQQGAMAQLLTKQKLDEYRRKQALQKMLTQGLIGDQAAPTMAAEPQTQFPMAGEVITPMQSQIIGRLPFGPTNERASLIGQTMPEGFAPPSLPAVSVSAKPRTPQDIFSSLSPQQRLLVANDPESLLPKVFEESMKRESFETVTGQDAADLGLDPRGRYQINYRTNQISTLQAPSDEFKIVTGLEAESYGLNGSSKWQVNKTSKQATLVPSAPGIFGGGIQGDASNIVIDAINSGKTDTVQYALAFRALNMPIPAEEMQADGSLKIVYKQPSPLPASFPQPTFKGKIPAVTKPVTVVPSTGQTAQAPVTARATAPVAVPVVSAAAGTATQLPAGVKSTPYAPTAAQIGDARKQILTATKLVSAIDLLEADVRQNSMQIGGMGEAGGRQEALFQDAILQLKELQNLGVLNGPDERILLQQLADPTSLKSFIKGKGGPEYVLSKIAELRNKANREVDMINSQFPQPITTPIAVPPPITIAPPPITIAPPPIIKDIMQKYPAGKP